MKSFPRLILLFFSITILLLFIIFNLFNVQLLKTSEYNSPGCVNLPPPQHIHPVFLAQGPKIRNKPQPQYKVSFQSNLNCSALDNKVVIIVHSHIAHTKLRDIKRRLFTNNWLFKNDARLLFVIGRNDTIDISMEYRTQNDILQVNIIENYHNISYKAQGWIKFIDSCNIKPALLIKIDDDVHVDLIGLQFLIQRYMNHDNIIACRVFPHGTVVRNPKSKWYLSKEEYHYNDLGTYCQGMAYIISGNLVPILHKNIARSQILWMDDWYVTRALIQNQKVSYYSIDKHILSTNSQPELNQRLRSLKRQKSRTIFAHFRPTKRYPIDLQQAIWNAIEQINNTC